MEAIVKTILETHISEKPRGKPKEHKGYVRRGEWSMSGIAAHKKHCKEGNVNFDNPILLATINADFKLDHMEALMIKLHQTGPGSGLNEDEGRRVRTRQWDPLVIQLRKKLQLNSQELET